MVQGDTRSSSGPKRPRTDGHRNQGDWTCPKCGNVNFAFRTTCNLRSCGTSKPADSVLKQTGGHVPTPYDQGPPSMYLGAPGGPSPMYMGGTGLTSAYSTHLPFSGASGPYDYNVPLSVSGPYGALHMPGSYGAPPGVVIGPGPGYGASSLMAINQGALIHGSIPGVFTDDNSSRKRRGGPGGLSEGDWECPKCGNTNFAFRTTCNMRKCSAPKPTENVSKQASGPAKGIRNGNSAKAVAPEGSWTCDKCGNVNYPFRTKCNRRNCGAEKPSEQADSVKSPLDEDQVLVGCNARVPCLLQRSF